MKNCYIYSHYTFGIGHIQRASLLAKGLSKKFKVFLFYSGEHFGLQFDKIHKVVRLTGEIKENRNSKFTTFENPHSTEKEIITNRINTIIEEFKKNKPEIFITEFFPFASFRLKKTIIPILKYIKSNYPKCKIICSARDFPISDRENISRYNINQLNKIIKKYYDLILIHAPLELSMFEPINPLFKEINNLNIKFTGYIVEKTKNKTKQNTKNKILITVGGGRDGKEIIKKVIVALSISKFKDELKIEIITGPFSNYSLKKIKNKNTIIKKYVPNLGSNLKNYKFIISMAGYNTIAEILYANVNAIIFPRPNSYEQKERAIRIASFSKNINLIHEKKSLIELKQIIEQELYSDKKNKLPKNYFHGIEKSINEIVSIVENE